jgi:DNA-binding response OmpR family regulator
MPGIDGLETLERIKKNNKDQIVIMITARGDVHTIIKLFQEGADDYIQKPMANEELLRALHSANEKRKLILENRKLKEK